MMPVSRHGHGSSRQYYFQHLAFEPVDIVADVGGLDLPRFEKSTRGCAVGGGAKSGLLLLRTRRRQQEGEAIAARPVRIIKNLPGPSPCFPSHRVPQALPCCG